MSSIKQPEVPVAVLMIVVVLLACTFTPTLPQDTAGSDQPDNSLEATSFPLTKADPTRTKRQTATDRPIAKPTITPSPGPDFSQMILMQSDLPLGYEPFELAELGLSDEYFAESDLDLAGSFGYVDVRTTHIVMGYTVLMPSPLERAFFDRQLDRPELLLDFLAGGLGTLEGSGEPQIKDGVQIGDASAGLTVDWNMAGQGLRSDFIIFALDDVGAVLMSMYPTDEDISLDLFALAQVFSRRIASQYATLTSSLVEIIEWSMGPEVNLEAFKIINPTSVFEPKDTVYILYWINVPGDEEIPTEVIWQDADGFAWSIAESMATPGEWGSYHSLGPPGGTWPPGEYTVTWKFAGETVAVFNFSIAK